MHYLKIMKKIIVIERGSGGEINQAKKHMEVN
jgi:hypothetical protein